MEIEIFIYCPNCGNPFSEFVQFKPNTSLYTGLLVCSEKRGGCDSWIAYRAFLNFEVSAEKVNSFKRMDSLEAEKVKREYKEEQLEINFKKLDKVSNSKNSPGDKGPIGVSAVTTNQDSKER